MWSVNTQGYMSARQGHGYRWLMIVDARTRDTHEIVSAAFWNDVYDREFLVDGQLVTFTAAYGSFVPPEINYEVGLTIGQIEIGFSNLSPEIDNILRAYETSGAPVRLYRVLFDNDGDVLETERMFKGQVSEFPAVIPETNGTKSATLNCVSSARKGTLSIGALKSDTSQKLRDPNDDFRKYASVSPKAGDYWGQ